MTVLDFLEDVCTRWPGISVTTKNRVSSLDTGVLCVQHVDGAVVIIAHNIGVISEGDTVGAALDGVATEIAKEIARHEEILNTVRQARNRL